MDTLTVIRSIQSDAGTFGTLTYPDGGQIVTGELPWHNNESAISCIPDGKYLCKWIPSDKWPDGKYHVTDVPDREAIEIHSGNFCGDVNVTNPVTGEPYFSHVEGCMILGSEKGILKGQDAVMNSKPTVAAFEKRMNKQDFFLLIKYL